MEKCFNSLEDCKRHIEQFFAQKDKKKFWEDGIMKFPEKWQMLWKKMVKCCSIKFLVKMNYVCFIFT